MFRVKQIRKEVGDEQLAERLVALVEVLSQLPCCRAGERVLLQQSCHLLQCGGSPATCCSVGAVLPPAAVWRL